MVGRHCRWEIPEAQAEADELGPDMRHFSKFSSFLAWWVHREPLASSTADVNFLLFQ